ncbi:HNH endonuclease [Brucella tritici]|uniref:HNH endonuclease n=1 Tax=Brucella tritici TaxID=94626 RepID=A0A7V7VSR3_9HYPH|nr:HNH endonuclease signature motif containing protein [Brucella tritici]KAB2656286.1 HNH endonuclease [Brucella tritici]
MMNRRDIIEQKIRERVIIDPSSGCWNWTGPTSGSSGRGHSYPRMSLDGQTVAVHRVMFTNVHGYVPGRKQIDHLCKNRCCVNPDHLEMVTQKTNCARRDGRA